MKHVRASADEILSAVVNLVVGTEVWADVFARLPKFVGRVIMSS
jgi:glycyl-tRNA synthetase